jgi:hypothetical protein
MILACVGALWARRGAGVVSTWRRELMVPRACNTSLHPAPCLPDLLQIGVVAIDIVLQVLHVATQCLDLRADIGAGGRAGRHRWSSEVGVPIGGTATKFPVLNAGAVGRGFGVSRGLLSAAAGGIGMTLPPLSSHLQR